MSAGWTIDTLREHFDRIIADLERRLDERIDGQKESVTVAMAASEKRFDGVNEFRQALGDTSRLQMPRLEAENLMKALNEKMEAADKGIAARLDAVTNTVVGSQGRTSGVHSGWGYAVGAVGLMIAVVTLVMAMKK